MGYLDEIIKEGWDVSDASIYDRVDMIAGQIREMPIADVLVKYGVRPAKVTYNRVLALCPFHMDEHIGSFSMDIQKNTCFCYSCMKGGDAIRAMSLVWNKSYKDTVIQIAADNKLISVDDFNKLSNTEYSDEYLVKQSADYVLPTCQKPDLATYKMWTDVYQFLRDYFGLTDDDYNYLKNVRKLSEERIRKDYFSFKVTTSKEASRIIFELKKKFPEYADKLGTIPGFYEVKVKDHYQVSMMMTDSLGILLRNTDGLVIAIQQRDRKPDSDRRYSYYSWKVGKVGECRGGGSVGTPIDVLFPDSDSKGISIVEGRFKSEILAQNGFISLSVQGVNNFRGIENDLYEIEQKTGKQIKTLLVFYDADQLRNGNVYKAGIKLAKYLETYRPDIQIKYVFWPPKKGKGIDDLILNGNKNLCRIFDKNFYIDTYEKNYEAAIKETKLNLDNLAKITKEERMQFFDIFERLNKADYKM